MQQLLCCKRLHTSILFDSVCSAQVPCTPRASSSGRGACLELAISTGPFAWTCCGCMSARALRIVSVRSARRVSSMPTGPRRWPPSSIAVCALVRGSRVAALRRHRSVPATLWPCPHFEPGPNKPCTARPARPPCTRTGASSVRETDLPPPKGCGRCLGPAATPARTKLLRGIVGA